MSVKKVLFMSISLISLGMNAHANVNCAKDCTKDVACKFKFKITQCVANCPDFTPAICGSNVKESPAVQTTQEPSIPDYPPPSLPTEILPEPQTETPKSTTGVTPRRPLGKLPSQHRRVPEKSEETREKALVSATGGKGVTASEIEALNEGQGVKVKHMKEKLEGLENLVKILQQRIFLLEPLADSLEGVQETLKKVLENTGFDKPEIRNNPEHDINYKPEQFSTASSASSTLDGISCDATLKRVQAKAGEIKKSKVSKDKERFKKLSTLGTQLIEMCKKTKDLGRGPGQKVLDAQEVNKVFAEAKKLF